MSQEPVDDLDEEWCPCGGPPCQTPAGRGCSVMTRRNWLAYWEQNDEHAECKPHV